MERKPRTCLKCSKTFDSEGPANRICPRCKKLNAPHAYLSESQLKKQRGVKRRNGEPIE